MSSSNSENENISTGKKSPQTSLNPFTVSNITIFCVFGFLIIMIIFFLCTTITFILLQQGVIEFVNPSNIYLPEGHEMYDFHTHIYRENELYRYNSDYLVLGENDYFDIMTSVDEQTGDMIVLSATEHISDREYHIPCEGTCECYLENPYDDDRRSPSLVYSSKYASVVIVSLIGFAVAKFVNNHVDECYDAARTALGNDQEVDDFLSCSMVKHFVECAEATEERLRGQDFVAEKWECNGYCLEMEDILDENAKKSQRDMDCENQFAGKQIIDLGQKEMEFWWHAKNSAMNVYRVNYLIPFCEQLLIHYYAVDAVKTKDLSELYPCEGFEWDRGNIECQKISTESES